MYSVEEEDQAVMVCRRKSKECNEEKAIPMEIVIWREFPGTEGPEVKRLATRRM